MSSIRNEPITTYLCFPTHIAIVGLVVFCVYTLTQRVLSTHIFCGFEVDSRGFVNCRFVKS